MNLDQFNDASRGGYPAPSRYEGSAAHRQRAPAAQPPNNQVFGQVRDFGGFQVTNFQQQIHEQHQPPMTNDFGHFNTYGSGGLASSAHGLRDDQGVPHGYHDNGGPRYGGGLPSGGGMQPYNLQPQAVSSGAPGLPQLSPYQTALGADDEQLGGHGYEGNVHPTHYMHQPTNHQNVMLGQGFSGGGPPGAHGLRRSAASGGRGGGPHGAQYRGDEDYFVQYPGADEINLSGHPGQYPTIPPKDAGRSARYAGSFRVTNPHAQYPGGQGGSRDSLVGSHGPLYNMGTGSGVASADAGPRLGSHSHVDAAGEGLGNFYRPAQTVQGELTARSAGPQVHGIGNSYHGGAPRLVSATQSQLPPRQAQIYASSVLSCDTAYTLEARSRIIDLLQLNREFKQAVKQRIGFDARRARGTVHRAYKQILAKRVARKLRKEGYFKATVYLETRGSEEQPRPDWRVEVFGEFTAQPWAERVPCRYDREARCFKADITIKQGHQFKFVVDNGRKYIVSARYAVNRDHHGNENNCFIPKELRWGQQEKKSPRPHTRTRSLYTVDRRQTTVPTAQVTRRLTPKAGATNPKDSRFGQPGQRPNYVGFDDLKPAPPALPRGPGGAGGGAATQGYRRNYLSALSPVRTSHQRADILKEPEANPASPRIGAAHEVHVPQQAFVMKHKAAPPMQRQTGAGAAGKRESSERGNAERMMQRPDAITWLGSVSDTSTLEQSPEQVKLFQDFRAHFEAFYRGEPFRQTNAGGLSGSWPSSGVDSAYAYNSDDEYADNLRQSGNFSTGAVADYKDDGGRTRAAQYQVANSLIDPGARQEIEYYKSFDNIFDLVEEQAAGEESFGANKADSGHFYQYSIENMHKRNQGALARQTKRKSPVPGAPSTQKKAVVKAQPVRSPPKVNPAAPKQASSTTKRALNPGSARKQQESPRSSERRGKASARATTDSPPATEGKNIGAQPQPKRSPPDGTESTIPSQMLAADSQKKSPSTPPPQGTQSKPAAAPLLEGSAEPALAVESRPQEQQQSNSVPTKSGAAAADKEPQLSQPNGEPKPASRQASPRAPGLAAAQPQSAPLQPRNVPPSEERTATIEATDVDHPAAAPGEQHATGEQPQEVVPDAGAAKEAGKSAKKSLQIPETIDGAEHDRDAAVSEISFFYEEGEEEEEEENDETAGAPFILLQGACRVGKAANQCEDAYFLLDRAFGVSDGVSGWNDYGFSSDQFSLQLMMYAKQMLEKYIKQGVKAGKGSKQARSVTAGGGMKRNRSLLSMDNLEIDEENDDSDRSEGAGSEDDSDGNKSITSGGARGGNDSRDSSKQRGKRQRGNFTERTARVESMADRTPPGESEQAKALTLEEEVAQKLSVVKISQDDINTWGHPEQGKDSGQQSKKEALTRDSKRYEATLFPTYILQKAYAKVNAVGSATAMIAILNKHELQIANIGDSGFLVVRFKKGEPFVPHRSKEQQHAFNIPFQLSQLPSQADLEILRRKGKREELARLKKVLRKKNHVCQDQPDSADDYTIELKDGDIVVSATDGVFDNLFQHEVLAIIKQYKETLAGRQLTAESEATELASILAEAAVAKFKNPQGKKTPYQRKYKKTYNATWEGGKEDDITVLISVARRVKVIEGQEGAGDAQMSAA